MKRLRRRSLVGLIVGLASALLLSVASASAAWELKSISLPIGGTEGELRGVSCFSENSCTAVGHYYNGTKWGASGNEWNGSTWSLAGVEANPGDKNGNLRSVSCYSATRCTAVGSFGSGGTGNTLVETSNKGVWKHPASPNPAGSTPELKGVSCVSLEYCLATGDHLNTGGTAGIIAEEWEGTTWNTMSPIENPGKQKNGKLWSVVCTAEASCRAVGNWGTESGTGVAGSETWNGTKWEAVETPKPTGATFSELFSIGCSSAGACMAVGSWKNSESRTSGFADRWNGTSWSLSETVEPSGATEAVLLGVSCPAAETCIAVGHYSNGAKQKLPLAEVWNGKSWSLQSFPTPPETLESELTSVSCTGIEACVAVGTARNKSNALIPIAAVL